jgi:hypothetical protein
MIYDFARDQNNKFQHALDVYKLIEDNERVVRRRSSAELGPGCPSCSGRREAEYAADAATRGRDGADRSALKPRGRGRLACGQYGETVIGLLGRTVSPG